MNFIKMYGNPANFLFVRGRIKLIDLAIFKIIMNVTVFYRKNNAEPLNKMSPIRQ